MHVTRAQDHGPEEVTSTCGSELCIMCKKGTLKRGTWSAAQPYGACNTSPPLIIVVLRRAAISLREQNVQICYVSRQSLPAAARVVGQALGP